MATLTKICGIICFVCVIAAAIFGCLLIWTNLARDLVLRMLITTGVLFLASSITIGIIQAMRAGAKTLD